MDLALVRFFAFLPLVGGIIHREVLRDELTLQGAFGEDYVRYSKLVRRYI